MQIRFPRQIRLGFRPVYGLTIRQLIYLAAFGIAGGLVILAGSFQGASLLVRALVGLVLIVAGLTLTFLRVGGLALDEWIPIGGRYLFRPRRRVWRKRDVHQPIVPAPKPTPSPRPTAAPRSHRESLPSFSETSVVPTRPSPRPTAVIVFLDAFILVALAGVTIYLRERGLYEVQLALAQLTR